MSASNDNQTRRKSAGPAARTARQAQVPKWLEAVLPGKKIPEGGFTPRQRRLIRIHHVRSSAGTLLLTLATVLLLLRLIGGFLPDAIGPFEADALGSVALSSLARLVLAIFIPVLVIVVLYRLGNRRISGKHRPSGSLMTLAVLAGIPVSLVFIGLSNILTLSAARFGWPLLPAYSIHNLQSERLIDILLMIVVFTALPSLLEEILFRGVLQSGLGATGRGGFAIFLQAIAFTLYYPWGAHVFAIFLLGLALGFLRWRTDSLALPVLTRFSAGLMILAINRLLPIAADARNLRGASGQSLLYASIVAAVVAILTLIPVTAIMFSFNERELRQANRPGSWVSAQSRVLVPVKQEAGGENVIKLDRDKRTEAFERPPVSGAPDPDSDEDILPAAASLWYPSDWKYHAGLLLLLILRLLPH